MKILHFLAKNKEKALHFCKAYGADNQIRTGDLILTKDALYLLSYISVGNPAFGQRIYNSTFAGNLQEFF